MQDMTDTDDDAGAIPKRQSDRMAVEGIREFWKRHGYSVNVIVDRNGDLRADLIGGLPRGYRGEEAVRVKVRTPA
jgi:hypothetical protein